MKKIFKKIFGFFCFAKSTDGFSAKKKVIFWVWNIFAFLAATFCLGALCLSFAIGQGGWAMLKSYFANKTILLLNVAPIMLLALILWAATKRSWLAFLITAVPTLVLAVSNYLKLRFRNDPLYFEDILYIREAAMMSGKYVTGLDKRIILAALLTLVAAAFLFFFARGKIKKWSRAGVAAGAIACVFLIRPMYFDTTVYSVKTANYDLIKMWSDTDQYICRGNVYPFINTAKQVIKSAPKGYRASDMEAILAAYPDADIPADKKVSVVSVMLEAFSDMSDWEQIQFKDDPYAALHELESQSYSGTLIDDIFAGGTIQSERSFLTGLNDLGSFRKKSNSYAWYFKNQGYTVEGCHPCFAWFYNRANINENLGFEKYWFVENYFADMTNNNVGYDNIFFPTLKQLYEDNLATGKPYFSFSVSYQGHGPYSTDIVWWGGDHVANENISEESRNIMNNYFDCMQDTSERILDLAGYFNETDDPVVLVIFGDHRPWFGDGNSVYTELGINIDVGTDEGFLNYYSTPYLIWANDAAKEVLGCDFVGEGETIGPYYLMNKVFELCSWDGPAFMQYMDENMKTLTVMNKRGVYIENGNLVRELSENAKTVFETYTKMQYYMIKHFIMAN